MNIKNKSVCINIKRILFYSNVKSIMNSDQEYEETNKAIKIIIIGDMGVGKTCILNRFAKDEFTMEHVSTIGVSFISKDIDFGQGKLVLHIWDTAGQEIYRSVTRSYYRNSSCALIIYDITSKQSFESVETWLQDVKANVPDHCKIFLVGNKIDLDSSRVISEEEGRKFADENNIKFFEVSAASGQNVNQLFIEGASDAINPNDPNKNPSELNNLKDIEPGKERKSSYNCC